MLTYFLRALLTLPRECNEVLPCQWDLGEVHKLRCLRPSPRPRIRARVRGHRGAAHHYLLHWIYPQSGIALAGADCFRLLQVSRPPGDPIHGIYFRLTPDCPALCLSPFCAAGSCVACATPFTPTSSSRTSCRLCSGYSCYPSR